MQKKRWIQIISLMILCTFGLIGCGKVTSQSLPQSQSSSQSQLADVGEGVKPGNYQMNVSRDETEGVKENELQDSLKIHIIDVGQGDSVLIQCGDQNLLIDAGENNMGDRVVSYLKSHNVKKLDYVIGTHPHSDHIGGLDIVIQNIEIGKVILPAVEHSTKTFEDVLLAIADKGKKITKPVVGNQYDLGEGSFQIIAPNSAQYEDLNDYSVGIRFVYGDTSYLFSGDADSVSEDEMCRNGLNLHSDVLKLNHHGSAYSNQKAFIDAVNPTYAVISVGEGNSYGHPHAEVLEDMKQRGIAVYRTDQVGTILITSDGKKIEFGQSPAKDAYEGAESGADNNASMNQDDDLVNEEQSENFTSNQEQQGDNADSENEECVYITPTGTKYHKAGCSYLKDNATQITIEQAIEEGYTPCSRCY